MHPDSDKTLCKCIQSVKAFLLVYSKGRISPYRPSLVARQTARQIARQTARQTARQISIALDGVAFVITSYGG